MVITLSEKHFYGSSVSNSLPVKSKERLINVPCQNTSKFSSQISLESDFLCQMYNKFMAFCAYI